MDQPRRLVCVALAVCVASFAVGQEIPNWPAPALWSPDKHVLSKGEVSTEGSDAVEGVPTPALHFVALNPCRLVDTRGNGFTGAYGPPALTQGVARNFVLTGRCGISATAQAVSLNVTVTNTQGNGFIKIYPQGAAEPTVSTLNYVAGQTIANAAVVPLGAGAGITVIAGVSGADLLLDTNGDYRAGVVTSINGQTGNVTLTSEGSIFIDPDPGGLFIDVNGGESRLLPGGTGGQTLRHDGTSWVASSALVNNEASYFVLTTANLQMNPRVTISSGSSNFLTEPGNGNTLLGLNTFTTGVNNTFVGDNAGGIGPGNDNTFVGRFAGGSGSGSGNVAIGSSTLAGLTSGGGNIAIGTNIAPSLTTGSNNLYIGNGGGGNESGQIRIGTNAVHTQGTVIASIHGFLSSGGIPVIVNSSGRLGTTTSSVRYKEDVRDLGPASEGLMSLRPVVFKYKTDQGPNALTQYGLIAEEVAEIYPELVVYDDEGRPQAIRSQLLDPLLLNEVQKQRREIDELKARLATLENCTQ